jgi:O-antigen ligase
MISGQKPMDRWTDGPMDRSPGTGTRILLFLLSIGFSGLLFLAGFPPAAPDRLPVLVIAVGLAVAAARKPSWAIVMFACIFPCAGLLTRLSGGTDPVAWPALLFGGLAAGWSFRFIYDFESRAEPSALDRPLRALLLVWIMATALAAARASTLWAVWNGLKGRVVNGDGLQDGAALRESLVAFSALAAGAVFFLILRRESPAVRSNALRAALMGVCASAFAAVLQRAGLFPQEMRPYWKMTGRIGGGAADPNSLGLLCALALVLVVAGLWRAGARPGSGPLAALVLAGGLFLSGSRTGFLLALFGILVLFLAGRLPSRARLASLAVLGAATVAGTALLLRGSGGSLGARIAQSFDSNLPMEYRVSARPILWRAAGRLFLRHPIEGAGMGAFSWRFPDLMSEERRRFVMRDNPGSAYVQALAETGAAGFFLTALFALAAGRQALRRAREEEDGWIRGAGVATAAFLVVLAVGSHWLATDVSLFFFLLAAAAAGSSGAAESRAARTSMLAAVAVYAAAAAVAILLTASPAETFRNAPRIGFHDQESGPGGPFRWTRRRFALWLEPGQIRRLVLAHFSPSMRPVDLSATLEGRPVFLRSLKVGESVALRLQGSAGRPRAVVFEVSWTFVPKRLGLSQDRRELGLLSIEPR